MEVISEQERLQKEIQEFRPPLVESGRFVKFFRNAERTSDGYTGLVFKVGERAIGIQVLNADYAAIIHAVHHIDDPEFKMRKGLRNSGAWDFMPEDKAVREKLLALEKLIEQKDHMNSERIAALNKRLDSLESELGVKKGK
jgi:hypothetical protein